MTQPSDGLGPGPAGRDDTGGPPPTEERPPDDLPPTRLARVWPAGGPVAVLADEMERRWQQGERPGASELLARHPELADDPDAVLDLLYQELRLRRRHGQEVPAEQVVARFPRHRDGAGSLLEWHPSLEGEPGFPQAGEALGDFRLLEELGRGAQGRVFLATQPALADRPVVLKAISRRLSEHLSLARLQHTHIVPLYWAQDDPARGLRLLCMPYFGRVTLARLLQALPPGTPRSGARVLEVLEADRDERLQVPARGPVWPLLQRASYAEAVCWVGACLAEALRHAHERGLVHLDVKPSNVLLAADGTPMLLDFHLARAPVPAGSQSPGWMGGTPNYMAPEHHAALTALHEGRPVPAPVGAGADLYSLGALLYEALGGTLPHRPGSSPPLHRLAPGVSVGLSDVVERCLGADPEARYPDAGLVAADLRRVLNHQPLRGVRNRSLRERWARWRQRRPYALPLLLMAGLLVAALGAGLHQWQQRLDQAADLLRVGRAQLRDGQYGAAKETLQRGLDHARDVPGDATLVRDFDDALAEAERRLGAGELHALADRVRYLYPFDSLSPEAAGRLRGACLALWSRRRDILDKLKGGEQVRTDLLDLALLAAELGQRQGPGTKEESLRLLDEAGAEFGNSAVLAYARSRLAGDEPAPAPQPRTPWEEYALGRLLLSADDLDGAARRLGEAVRSDPGGVWPNFYLGQCAYRRGRYVEAVAAFSACVGASPELAAAYVNRGLAYDKLGEPGRAAEDLAHGLALDRGLGAAWLELAILHLQAGRPDEALPELDRALAAGADLALVCYNRALAHAARGERSRALADLRVTLAHDPGHAGARSLKKALEEGRDLRQGPRVTPALRTGGQSP
jgi:serine/threonine protein kinase/tetratricopeptide (TPR) repeat protein